MQNPPTPNDTHPSPISEVAASAALLLFSLAVVAGFARVFEGWSFFEPLALIALVGHGVSLALRLVRTPVWAAFPATVATLVVAVCVLFYRESLNLFLPTADTLELFRLDIERVGEAFRTEVAPAPFADGWDVVASIGVVAAVLLADTFAFRAYARAEALVPGGVLFVFVAALGTDRSRVASSMVLVAAGVLTTVVLRHHHASESSLRIGLRPRLARAFPAAAASALGIALVAGAIGPRLPGADAEALYDTTGSSGGRVTEIISPLVDIRSRLTNRSDTVLFTVRADGESYWRSSALAEFDGRLWGLPERGLSTTEGALSPADAPNGSVILRQQVRIEALGGRLLPAAADPRAASGADGTADDELRFNPDSATLVKTGNTLEEGDVFDIESASPRYSAAVLSGATSTDAGDSIFLELPADFPSSIGETTREVTAGATSSYEAALALQNWMRTEFQYSLDIQEGHGNNEIEGFLERRVGYCEQFAGSYAAMLRTIGIPTRVAVGFTSGSVDEQGAFSVLGRNAHAWPEVWFDGVGWVPFEPTPGRGAPNAQEYTGIAPQQDDGTGPGDGSAPTTTVPVTETTLVPGEGGVQVPNTPVPNTPDFDDLLPEPVPQTSDVVPTPETDDGLGWGSMALLAVVALGLLAPAAVRRIRRRAPVAPERRLAGLWDRAIAAVSETGVEATRDLTPTEAALATAAAFPVAARPMRSLAEAVTIVEYAPSGSTWLDSDATFGRTALENCASWCRQVERAVADTMGPAARVKRYFTTWR
ncbi:MAG: DUF3488 and transglutaminase-like domain-containing protein [Ilumatobacter sp.]